MKKFTLLLSSVFCYGVMNAQMVLFDNGPLVNSPGAGAGGADVSNLHDGLTNFGIGHAVSTGYKVADDFTVPVSGWNIDSIVFFGYQTGSGNTSSISGVKMGIWDGSPAGGANIIYGDTGVNATTLNTYWSGIYRTTETTLTDVQRPIMRNVISTPGLTLTAGTYFASWQTDGSASFSGPWAPPVTLGAGVVITGDALQYNPTTLAWTVINDPGALADQGLPFIIYGSLSCGIALSPVSPCPGICNGFISLIQPGGIGPFSYLWTTGDTLTFIDSLCTGNYSVTVTDSTGCTATAQTTLTSPDAVATSVNVQCNGACNGTASVIFQGGVAPFTYLWNTSATTDNIANLCPGIYSVTVQDSMQCLDSASVTITEPDSINSVFSGVNVLCNGQCNGSFLDSITGGTAPYAFTTCTGQNLVPGTLCAGNYCVTITDVNGCTNSNGFIITEPAPLTVTNVSQNTSCYICTDGFIALNISGGTPAYAITWIPANGNLSNDSIINLAFGIYIVTITDSNGCTTSFTDTITSPVGIQNYDEVSNDLITLYPNPATDKLIISLKENADVASLSITDVSGRIVKALTVSKGQNEISFDLSKQSAGIYFITASSKTATVVSKFVKE